MESEGRKRLGLANQALESGDFVQALELSDQATVESQKEGDALTLAETQASRFLIYRHLYEATQDRNYLILAKHAAMAGVDIAKENGQKEALALPLFNLAKALETLGQVGEAVKYYREAVENMQNNPPPLHNRPGVLADMQVHLATCEYKNGDESALGRAETALGELEASDEVKYNKDVWVSGGHMRIAEALRNDNSEKAREHLQKAKQIIDANPDLKLRAKQWERLNQSF